MTRLRNMAFLLMLFTFALTRAAYAQPQCYQFGTYGGFCYGFPCEDVSSWCNNDGWGIADGYCFDNFGTYASSITECREEEPSFGVCQISFECWPPE